MKDVGYMVKNMDWEYYYNKMELLFKVNGKMMLYQMEE